MDTETERVRDAGIAPFVMAGLRAGIYANGSMEA